VLPSGLHYLHVVAVDAVGNAGPVAHLGPFRIDLTAPAGAAVTSPSAATPYTRTWNTATKVPTLKVTWAGASDAHSGVGTYRVAYRSAPSSTGAFGVVAFSPVTTATSWTTNTKPGSTYCVRVETTDRAGNTAPLSAEKCTAAPLDNAALAASVNAKTKAAQWTKPASAGSYFGTVSQTSIAGATLKSGTVKAKRLAIVVDKCAACGSVSVYWNGTLLGTYSLAGSGTHVVVPVKAWTTLQSGVVTVKSTVAAKVVKIDALCLSVV
jgi:hypothetical protein